MYSFTSVTWSALLSYHMDPYRPVGCRNRSRGDPTWSFLTVICTLLLWLRSGSCLHRLGSIQLSVTVHAASQSLLCGFSVNYTQSCARTFATPALLSFCSEKLSKVPGDTSLFLYWAGKNVIAQSCVISTKSPRRLSTISVLAVSWWTIRS